ncbi:hypothetical protein EIB96_14320 [Vibrio parahaemolyticus]|nr:hypothetical protein [Vibrio parahaemolyticus]EGR1949114.1 hypothetical protein [Vibrio parahaemolyticus]
MTKRLRRIRNAWHSRFALNSVFTAQWFRFCGSVAHHLTRRYMQWRTKRWNLKNIYNIRASTLKN